VSLISEFDPAAVASDLRGRVEGDLLFDDLGRTLYSTAACIYQVRPLGAVVPRHEADVRAVIDYARRHRIPITARGGGSGLAGQTLGRGIVLDFSRHFRSIGEVDTAARTVRVGPGVVPARLNRHLAPSGLHFAPDPSSSAWCTIGGMVANNAGGSHTVGHGATRDNVASLRIALADGRVIETRPLARSGLATLPAADGPAVGGAAGGDGTLERLAADLMRLVDRRRDVIEARQPRTRRNSSGYALRETLGDTIDLGKVLIGSEGTLGLVVDATLRLTPLPKAKATALVLFDDLEKAGAGVVEILRFAPAAVELLDRTFVEVVRAADPGLASTLPSGTEAILIVELDGDDAGAVGDRLERLQQSLAGRLRLATEVRRSTRPEETA
jgi:FAD/FMN-containing dehydrogenase